MSRLAVLFLVAALACSSDNNELKGTSAALAVKRAATFCNVSASEMTWLGQLIEESKNDIAKEGPIYAFHSNGQGVFMVQPWIMSCLACIMRSEEHTSELQSRENLVCRLLLEKKKENKQ